MMYPDVKTVFRVSINDNFLWLNDKDKFWKHFYSGPSFPWLIPRTRGRIVEDFPFGN